VVVCLDLLWVVCSEARFYECVFSVGMGGMG